ncbi:hypothetical protein [Actinomadura kijaniata]|uniref:hypothetical protein n=1 Tax=Actinomadura kijaniata TaxID=46161 RepID=UPI0008297A3D|nr:hypothetical protein [Actinomadura kijaniata]
MTIAPVLRRRRDGDAAVRRLQTVASLAEKGRMSAEFRLPGAAGPVLVETDLRAGQIETTVEVPAAARARALTRVQWQLTDAPPEPRVEALGPGERTGPCELLADLVSEPGPPVPEAGAEIVTFRLTLPTPGARSGERRSPASSAAWTWRWTASTSGFSGRSGSRRPLPPRPRPERPPRFGVRGGIQDHEGP